MLSGPDALQSIDRGLNEAQRDLETTQARVKRATDELAALDESEAESYRKLARARLDALARDEVLKGLDASDKRARALLADHANALEVLEERVAEAAREQERSERQRDAQAERVAAAIEAFDDAVAETQQRLTTDAPYQAQLTKTKQADAVAANAENKTELAQADRDEKGRPYEAGPLFMYLWNRGYGTPRYRAGTIARFFDRKVARLCRFDKARANYHMLCEIPKRLAEHAATVRAAAEDELAALEDLENAAMTADGVDALRDAVAREEQALNAIEEQIAAAEAKQQELDAERTRLFAGDDDHYREAHDVLVRALRRDSLRDLRRDAHYTRLPDDDVVVEELADIEDRRDDLEDDIDDLKGLIRAQEKRLRELQGVRRDFKRRRYDDRRSEFADGSIIPILIGELLKGAISRDGFWGSLKRQHKFRKRRADPGFGSGRMGRGGGPWSGGRIGRGGRPLGGRRVGGGGFRTGGSF